MAIGLFRRFVHWFVKEPLNLDTVEVGDAQGFHQLFIHQFFPEELKEVVEFSNF